MEETLSRVRGEESSAALLRRRPVIIHRGYATRVYMVRAFIESFLRGEGRRQVVFLGSGFDSAPLLLLSSAENASSSSSETQRSINVFEVDFEDVISMKQAVLEASRAVLLPVFVAADLRSCEDLFAKLSSAGFDPTLPTLIVTECVFLYLEKSATEALCARFGATCAHCAWLSYDMISPSDSFGRVMLRNLTSRGFHLPGVIDFPDLFSQEKRFLQFGWTQATSRTMLEYYRVHLSADVRTRIEAVELLDEIEEWQLIMNHYAVTIAVNCTELTSLLFVS